VPVRRTGAYRHKKALLPLLTITAPETELPMTTLLTTHLNRRNGHRLVDALRLIHAGQFISLEIRLRLRSFIRSLKII